MAKDKIVVPDEFDPSKFQFKTMEDYDRYNSWARKNKVPVKVPTEDFYKKVKVKFQRFEQPENVLKTRMRTREIDWRGQLKSGCVYYLAEPVVKFLNSLATPIFENVVITESNGWQRTEMQQTGERSRFSCQIMEFAQ